MTASLADWLTLREPADAAARSLSLTRRVVASLPSTEPVRVLDLATGTGANLRYLVEHLPAKQEWLVTDLDPGLLERLVERTTAWAVVQGYEMRVQEGDLVIRGERLDCRVRARQLDLNELPADLCADRQLVTASALLDLVSARWLGRLAAQCKAVGASALFALNYDGRSSCSPAEAEDALLCDLLNRHQLKDKGLGGPAAGPAAERWAVEAFEGQGYRVLHEPTDWRLDATHAELQRQLMDGWIDAALDLEPGLADTVAAWRQRRHQHLESGRSVIVVGHHDVAAWLPSGAR